jgi:hypothetical protein
VFANIPFLGTVSNAEHSPLDSVKHKQFSVPQSAGSIFFAEASLVTIPIFRLACVPIFLCGRVLHVRVCLQTKRALSVMTVRSASALAASTACSQFGTTRNQSGARAHLVYLSELYDHA